MLQRIVTKTTAGEIEVNAECFGPFAIHHHPGVKRKWTLTHLPSGRALLSDLPRRMDAILAMDELYSIGIAWGLEEPAKKAHPAIKKEVAAILQKYRQLRQEFNQTKPSPAERDRADAAHKKHLAHYADPELYNRKYKQCDLRYIQHSQPYNLHDVIHEIWDAADEANHLLDKPEEFENRRDYLRMHLTALARYVSRLDREGRAEGRKKKGER